MNKTLYLECSSGISGDMTVAALVDLGAEKEILFQALQSLEIKGFKVRISRVKKAGLDACDFSVELDELHENHDHDMEYLHGRSHHSHCHGHAHHEQDHVHEHEHRGLKEIFEIIRNADITPAARKTAEKIFQILAEAEAKAHGVPVQEVHFHEVGAVDSIVDIVAVAVCLDNLGITRVIIPRLCEGQGTVRCQHGILPVPVPAVVNIVSRYNIPLHITETQGELVTPTGAAIAAAVSNGNRLPEEFIIEKVGLGAGKRNYDRPSLLRAMLLTESETQINRDKICRLETNIDDCSGESLGYVMDRLFEAGAKDVHYSPVFMKKNRPAYQLNIICSLEDTEKMENIIFRETTTIGIRRQVLERSILDREIKTVSTSLGNAKVKVCTYPDGEREMYPEYEDVARLAKKNSISYQKAYDIIKHEGKLV